jgi:hypothetical protein
MLFGETVAVYCDNTNTLCGQNAEFDYVKAGGNHTHNEDENRGNADLVGYERLLFLSSAYSLDR